MMEYYNRPGGAVKYREKASPLFSRHQGDLGKNMRRRGLHRDKGQLQVIDDPVHHEEIREEGDNLFMEDARLVHSALGHQEMEVRMKVPQEPAIVLEEDPQHLGDGENDLIPDSGCGRIRSAGCRNPGSALRLP